MRAQLSNDIRINGQNIKLPSDSWHVARFTIWLHCYIQMRQVSQNMDNFIFFYSAEATTEQCENQ
jgi:hypothetical protein